MRQWKHSCTSIDTRECTAKYSHGRGFETSFSLRSLPTQTANDSVILNIAQQKKNPKNISSLTGWIWCAVLLVTLPNQLVTKINQPCASSEEWQMEWSFSNQSVELPASIVLLLSSLGKQELTLSTFFLNCCKRDLQHWYASCDLQKCLCSKLTGAKTTRHHLHTTEQISFKLCLDYQLYCYGLTTNGS